MKPGEVHLNAWISTSSSCVSIRSGSSPAGAVVADSQPGEGPLRRLVFPPTGWGNPVSRSGENYVSVVSEDEGSGCEVVDVGESVGDPLEEVTRAPTNSRREGTVRRFRQGTLLTLPAQDKRPTQVTRSLRAGIPEHR